jgi:NAD-dependent dihydropyrimidine dehydrogenase PreA subunit
MTEHKYLRGVATLKLDSQRCTGCNKCRDVCPHAVFEPSGKKVRIARLDACMECGACRMNCAFDAISVEAGVGCAAAMIYGALTGTEPTCGCDEGQSSSCC